MSEPTAPARVSKYDAPPYLGDYVTTAPHGYRGRVYQIHWSCPESEAWVAGQSVPIPKRKLSDKWVSVLVDSGGAIVCPAEDCTVVEPFPFSHRDAVMLFGPA